MMTKSCQDVYQVLNKLQIPYEIIEHQAALSALEADEYIKEKEGFRTKTLFLCNRKKTGFYLIIVDDTKNIDFNYFEKLTNEKGLHFASENTLMKKLGLKPNTVSIFGLINNFEQDIQVYIDENILKENMVTFHPNDNTKTVFITVNDMFRFLKYFQYRYSIIKI